MLDLGEELFDPIGIGGVLRQEEQPRAGLADGGADRPGLVRAEIVHHDDVAGLQLRHQHLFDIDKEACRVDRTVDDPGRADAINAQGGNERHGVPVAEGSVSEQPFAARRPASQRRHVRLRPGVSRPEEFHLPAYRRTVREPLDSHRPLGRFFVNNRLPFAAAVPRGSNISTRAAS